MSERQDFGDCRPVHKSVVFTADRVIKRQAPEDARAERIRTENGAWVGRATGRFIVPHIESFNESNGEIEFERLHDVMTLEKALAIVDDPDAIVRRAGAVLAAIHSQPLDLLERRIPPRAMETERDGLVSVHGDFGLGNVLYSSSRDELAVVDW